MVYRNTLILALATHLNDLLSSFGGFVSANACQTIV